MNPDDAANQLPDLILASASPRRAELLNQLEVRFQVVPSEAEEIRHDYLTAPEIAQINAARKARQVAKCHVDALVLGADTLVYVDDAIFGKPRDREHALSMLRALRGRTHHVVTAVCLLKLRSHRQRCFAEITDVTFKPFSDADLVEYLDRVDPLDKAGGYAIQENAAALVSQVDGSYSNVVGLPLERLNRELQSWDPSLFG